MRGSIILITGSHPLAASLKVLALLAVIWLALHAAERCYDHYRRRR